MGRRPFDTARRACAALILAALAPGTAGAQDCGDPAIRPLDGPEGYRARTGDARCEGLYESPVSGRALDIVSATVGAAPEPAPPRLRLSVPGAEAGETLQLRAEGLPPRLYYRMTAEIAGKATFSWPLGEVLGPAGIGLDAVGILARASGGDRPAILPVAFGSGAGPVQVTVRSVVDLDRLVWRLTPDGEAPRDWQEVPGPLVPAGAVRTFTVEGSGAGLLAVRGRRAGTNDWIALDAPVRLPAR